MIYRLHPQPPDWFADNAITARRQNLIREWLENDSQRLLVRWVWEDIENFLERFSPLFDNKCVYCETHLDSTLKAKVNFFRPYEHARQTRKDWSRSDENHYRWLSWDWTNLYLACADCAKVKGPIFPTIEGRRARIGAFKEELDAEPVLLLNPCDPKINPLDFLLFQEDGKVASQMTGMPDRGEITIEVLDLNRSDLVTARCSAIKKLRIHWNSAVEAMNRGDAMLASKYIEYLQNACGENASFAGMTRQMLYFWRKEALNQEIKPWIDFRQQLGLWNGSGSSL